MSVNKFNAVVCGNTTFTFIGTNHADERSKKLVVKAVESGNYDAVAVELCEERLARHTIKGLPRPSFYSMWKSVGFKGALFSKGISNFYHTLRTHHKIDVGGELFGAVDAADTANIPYTLIDQNSQDTMRRIGEDISVFRAIMLYITFQLAAYGITAMSRDEVIKLVNKQDSDDAFGSKSPFAKIRASLRDERDLHMVTRLKHMTHYKNVLVVVGAAHVDGMVKLINAANWDCKN